MDNGPLKYSSRHRLLKRRIMLYLYESVGGRGLGTSVVSQCELTLTRGLVKYFRQELTLPPYPSNHPQTLGTSIFPVRLSSSSVSPDTRPRSFCLIPANVSYRKLPKYRRQVLSGLCVPNVNTGKLCYSFDSESLRFTEEKPPS